MAMNEAMSFGKPVIATDMVGSSYELIHDGINGYVVPQRQVSPLYEAIKRAISNPELEGKMGAESKRIIAGGYTYKHMANGFKQAIEFVQQKYNLKTP